MRISTFCVDAGPGQTSSLARGGPFSKRSSWPSTSMLNCSSSASMRCGVRRSLSSGSGAPPGKNSAADRRRPLECARHARIGGRAARLPRPARRVDAFGQLVAPELVEQAAGSEQAREVGRRHVARRGGAERKALARQRAAGLREFGQRGVETRLGAAARANQGPEAGVDLAQRAGARAASARKVASSSALRGLVALGRGQGVKAVERLRPGTCRVVAEGAEACPQRAIEGGLGRAAALGGRAELVGQARQEAAQRRIGRREFRGLARRRHPRRCRAPAQAHRAGATRRRSRAGPGACRPAWRFRRARRGRFCRRRTSPPVSPSTQSASFASSSKRRLERRREVAPPVAGAGMRRHRPGARRREHEGAGRAEARRQVLRRLGVGHASQQALVHALRQRQRREGAARRAHAGIVGAHRLGQPAALEQGIDMARPFGALAGAACLRPASARPSAATRRAPAARGLASINEARSAS